MISCGRSLLRPITVITASAVVAGCGSSSLVSPTKGAHSSQTRTGPLTAAKPTVHAQRLIRASSRLPTAGICASSGQGSLVTVYVGAATPEPRCIRVRANQHLRVIDRTLEGQPQRSVTITWLPYPTRRLAAGRATVFTRNFGSYLASGVHDLGMSVYAGGGAEIWLVHPAAGHS
jgi:hypothetical protein